jgi:hypothetical protein
VFVYLAAARRADSFLFWKSLALVRERTRLLGARARAMVRPADPRFPPRGADLLRRRLTESLRLTVRCGRCRPCDMDTGGWRRADPTGRRSSALLSGRFSRWPVSFGVPPVHGGLVGALSTT